MMESVRKRVNDETVALRWRGARNRAAAGGGKTRSVAAQKRRSAQFGFLSRSACSAVSRGGGEGIAVRKRCLSFSSDRSIFPLCCCQDPIRVRFAETQ